MEGGQIALQVDRTEVVESQSGECTDLWWMRGRVDMLTGQRDMVMWRVGRLVVDRKSV